MRIRTKEVASFYIFRESRLDFCLWDGTWGEGRSHQSQQRSVSLPKNEQAGCCKRWTRGRIYYTTGHRRSDNDTWVRNGNPVRSCTTIITPPPAQKRIGPSRVRLGGNRLRHIDEEGRCRRYHHPHHFSLEINPSGNPGFEPVWLCSLCTVVRYVRRISIFQPTCRVAST